MVKQRKSECVRERDGWIKKKLKTEIEGGGDVVRRRLYVIIIHIAEVLVDDGRRRRGGDRVVRPRYSVVTNAAV